MELSDTPDTAYCQGDHIVLPKHLLEEFTNQKLPRFTVLYHELGHALYSHNLNDLIKKWENLPTTHNVYAFNEKYMHLLNWIEDYYIENKLVQDYPYLKDLLSCLKRLTLPYDINDLDKAFNHYYVKGHASSSLSPLDAVYFSTTINKLLSLRDSDIFGRGPVTLLSQKSKETQYIKLLIEFYNWCVTKGIFEDNKVLPQLSNPNSYVPSNQSGNTNNNTNNQPGKGGAYSQHSHIIGSTETFPTFVPEETAIFSDKFVAEQKQIKDEINKQFRVESTEQSLDGLFNSLFKDTSIIQPKVIVPNFFNPNRLVDQVLFKAPAKSFNNVSIYRDISGSTYGRAFVLINDICKFLNEKIPISYNFYLYSSGDISIMQTEFKDWDNAREAPEEYENNPIFQQLEGGTNSSAIADVMTEQLNDKWLNIIVTDGDLYDLMQRDNIEALLKNVFVISLTEERSLQLCPNYIIVKNDADIERIPAAILNMKEV